MAAAAHLEHLLQGCWLQRERHGWGCVLYRARGGWVGVRWQAKSPMFPGSAAATQLRLQTQTSLCSQGPGKSPNPCKLRSACSCSSLPLFWSKVEDRHLLQFWSKVEDERGGCCNPARCAHIRAVLTLYLLLLRQPPLKLWARRSSGREARVGSWGRLSAGLPAPLGTNSPDTIDDMLVWGRRVPGLKGASLQWIPTFKPETVWSLGYWAQF